MTVQTLTMTALRYHKARKTDQWLKWDALPGGEDMIHKLHGLFKTATLQDLRDSKRSMHVEVEKVEQVGRTVLVTFAVGRGGLAGAMRDSDGNLTHEHGPDETHTIHTQVLFVSPAGGTCLLMFADHTLGLSASTAALDLVKKRWVGQYSRQLTLDTALVTYGNAWIETAEVEGVTAFVNQHTADVSDEYKTESVGRLRHELRPLGGSRFINNGKKLLKKLKSADDAGRGKLLGLKDEPDEIRVTLGDGAQSRTFVLGHEKTPVMRAVLAEDGEPPRLGGKFTQECRKEATHGAAALSDLAFTWNDQTSVGTWTPEQLAIRWDHVSG